MKLPNLLFLAVFLSSIALSSSWGEDIIIHENLDEGLKRFLIKLEATDKSTNQQNVHGREQLDALAVPESLNARFPDYDYKHLFEIKSPQSGEHYQVLLAPYETPDMKYLRGQHRSNRYSYYCLFI